MNYSETIITRAVEWPTEIQPLSCLLDLPIPAQLVDDSCPTVSTRASPLLKELRGLLSRSSGHLSESQTEVLDVLDIVLSSVGTLRALSRMSSNDNLHATKSIWSLLIRSLVRACYVDSHALEDATFVRPRSPYVHSMMEDGHAFLLMSHLVDDIWPEKSQAGNVVSERPCDNVEGRQDGSTGYGYGESVTTSYDEESISRSTGYGWSDTSTDPTSAQSSSIPLDAHIVAYWPHQRSAVLPFLCVAGEDDIFDLMRGLLYQRCAWGVVEPVIGIILSTAGYVGRVVLGWSEEAIRDPGVLPIVHFAYADGTRTDPSIGVYDLTNPESTLKFAQFILSLRTHVEAVVRQCNQPVFKRLPWRSDTIDDEECGPEEQWEQRITNWLHSVEGCRHPFPLASPLPTLRPSLSVGAMGSRRSARTPSRAGSEPVHSHYTRPWSVDSSEDVSPGERARLLLQQSSDFSTTDTTTTDSVPPTDEHRGRSQKPKPGGRQHSSDALSCSRLGTKALQGIGPGAKLSFSSYSHDRKMAGIANVKLPAGAAGVDPRLIDEINHQLDFYEDMTRYLKPPIAHLSGIPHVDRRIKDLRKHFFEQMKDVSKRNEASEQDSDDDDDGEVDLDSDKADLIPVEELDQEYWEIIAGSFSHLLWASVGAYTKLLGGKTHNEAEARHDWDALLNLGFVASGEVASARLLFERPLSLSRNVAVDLLKSSEPRKAKPFKDHAKALHGLCFRVRDTLAGRSVRSPIYLQADQATYRAHAHIEEVDELFASMDVAVRTIIKRGMAEPDFGICDAILMLPVDLRCKNTEPLIRLTGTGDSLQAAKLKMLTDDQIEEQEDRQTSLNPKARSRSKGQSRGSKSVNSSRWSDLGSIAEEHDGLERSVQAKTPAQKLSGAPANKDKTDSDEQTNGKGKDWQTPFAVTCSETCLNKPKRLPMAVINIQELLTKLLLAVLIAEYKKPSTSYKKALYQTKMYLDGSVRYLASLGITNRAVFGLATNGVQGAILMAWFSEITNTVYIVERNLRTFDISSPIQVYHFVTVLLRLRRDSDTKLKKLVEKVVGEDAFVQTTWTKTAQYERYPVED
ncbi:hypothetical protein IW261DRAFT_1491148 [Armillaria novae-zelandiae]|uniref:Uncharacterized protein n=1 Tax=Armillaria novae-zelandiae TaxID=153914 RepID=A0AA39P350_9AGAR|nr:hypothetical protein IW261DRAFT_1491148 [Armillaria novae-zelandiae]